jgi:hypothetical protein
MFASHSPHHHGQWQHVFELSLVPSLVFLLRLQSNLVGGFRLILRGFCAILRSLCAIFGLLEQHHLLHHIWYIGSSFRVCSNSFSASVMILFQSFS